MSRYDIVDREYVKIGVEIGEHDQDYENIINHLKTNFDIRRIDFVLMYMSPVDIREELWYEWAEFFKENDIHFAFLYTQQRGAPKGKVSHFTKEIVARIKEIAGGYFIGDMIGETGGLASWQEGYYEDVGMPKPQFADMEEAKKYYIDHVKSVVDIDRGFEVPAVLAVEATTFSRYNFEAGVDYTFIEMLCGNPEIIFASARGAVKAYGREWWGCHIAPEWYGGLRNEDPLKYKRSRLAYYYAFLSGAKYVYPESGHLKIESYGDVYTDESEFCRSYRESWDDFADFVHLHKRPKGGPKVSLGFVQGNLDSWTGWGGATVWNQFNKKEWVYGAAENSWEHLNRVFEGEKWHVPTVYGEQDATNSVPYGQYDIVPAEAPLEVLSQYECLVFTGWNTMTDEIYDKFKKYVYNGGKLFMSLAHLNMNSARDGEMRMVKNGDYSDLFGCVVSGEGRELNWGVKFIEDSGIPGYKYPYTKNGMCDPICNAGTIKCPEVELTGGKAVAILSDKFRKWRENSPVLMVENAYGKGFASLITSWDYPGSAGLGKFVQVLLRAVVSGEQEAADIKVFGSDKIFYAVYPLKDGQYRIYLLNTDYNVPNKVKLTFGNVTGEIEVKSCDMEIVQVTKNVLSCTGGKKVEIESIEEGEASVEILVTGPDKPEIYDFYPGREVKITRVEQ